MSIPLHISPRIIQSIASLYSDTNRIFMEYIDNSLDSADTYFFDKERNAYSKPIEITIKIEGEKFNNWKVTIIDNCFGITNFIKVVKDVGNSDKKAQPWTNGQFGYGIYSFIACCGKLEIISKLKNNPALYLPIERGQFNVEKQEDVKFPDPKRVQFPCESGTEIILSKFDRDMWKQIDFNEIKNEIEKHFELVLSRKNLTIKLVFQNEKVYICQPFNYDQYEGDPYEDHIDKLSWIKGTKKPQKRTINLEKPIHIFLKVTKGRAINKPPVFIVKGRRIAEIKDIKLFRSKHKSDLWGHPNMTGYIDLSDYLEPTIARNDFRNNDRSRALFYTLEELELLILDVIKDINNETVKQHYKNLEDVVNNALSQLAKRDAMNFRTDYITGSKENLLSGGVGQKFEDGFGTKDWGGLNKIKDNTNFGGENEGYGKGPSGEEGDDTIGDQEGGDSALNKRSDNPFEDIKFHGEEKRRSGFNFHIREIDPPIDEAGRQLRSELVGSDINVFRKHPEFVERVEVSRRGETRVSQRLITYLSGEITVHYKDRLQTRQGQPEYSKRLFENLVEFIYQLETMLKNLSGRNLSDFNE